MKKLRPIKRGDTFAFYADIKDAEGSPIEISAQNIRCQFRDNSDKLVSELTTSATDTPGKYLFTEESTGSWPVGILQSDIELTIDGVITSSETFSISVEKDVTR